MIARDANQLADLQRIRTHTRVRAANDTPPEKSDPGAVAGGKVGTAAMAHRARRAHHHVLPQDH